jgi:hypothetical protein
MAGLNKRSATTMLTVSSYESQSFFITPAALAVTEPRPATIADQRWIFQMNGVALVDMRGKTNTSWHHDQLLISPNLGTALIPALTRYAIPPVPGGTPWMQVDSSIPFATLSSIFDEHHAVDMGFAVDRWKIQTRRGTEAGTGQTLQDLLSGMVVDLAVRDSDAILHRVSFNITVQGKIKFVTSLG